MITLVIVNVVLVVLALVFAVKEWKLTPSKIKDKVLSAAGGLGSIGGGLTVTRVTPDAKLSRHGHLVRVNGKLVGAVVRDGGSIKVVNPEDAPPPRVEQPKQERPQQNQPQQNQNNNQPRRDEQRRDERRNDQRRDGRDERRDQRPQDRRDERRN